MYFSVFAAMGGLELVGVGAIAVQLEASKNATYRCRLNNREYVTCEQILVYIHSYIYVLICCKGIDGQVFSGLAAGQYTLFIEATAVDNVNEVAYDTVGPVVIVAGVGATPSEAIGKCLDNHLVPLCNFI